MADCVVIVPMLRRAALVDRLAASLAASTDDARLLFVVTDTDAPVLEAVQPYDHLVVPKRGRGDYAHKINHAVTHSDEPLIFTAAIDLHFHAGWLDAARECLSDTVRVVGTNDLTARTAYEGHSTHTLVTRDYAKRGLVDGRPGLLCEDYLHEFVDDELIGTAILRGAYRSCPDAVVEHLHPALGKGPWDMTYRAMPLRMATDADLFEQRRKLWQPMEVNDGKRIS